MNFVMDSGTLVLWCSRRGQLEGRIAPETESPRRPQIGSGPRRLFAQAFGVRHWRVASDPAFESALQQAVASEEPAVIEVKVEDRA